MVEEVFSNIDNDELIRYDILDVLSVESRTSDFAVVSEEETEILQIVCMVQSEYGEVFEHLTYWGKNDWDVNRLRGFYYMPDALLLAE